MSGCPGWKFFDLILAYFILQCEGLQEGHVIQLARRILPATTCTSAGVADPSPVGENNPLVILNDQQSSVDTNHQVLEAIQNIMMSTNQRASHGRAQVQFL